MSIPDEAVVAARPERLQRFRVVGAEVAEALGGRAGALDDAAFTHEARTEPTYQVRVRQLVPAVAALAAALEDLGTWVGQVGDAFVAADGDGGDGGDGPVGLPRWTFDRLFATLPTGVVPGRALLGPATTPQGPFPPGEEPDPAPTLLDFLGAAGDPLAVVEAVLEVAEAGGGVAAAAGRGTTVAGLLSSRPFHRIVTGAGWAGAGLGVVTGAGGRWIDDQPLDLSVAERVGRAAAQAGIETGSAAASGVLAATVVRGVSSAIGAPAGPVGVVVTTVVGSYVGGWIGQRVADAALDDEPDPVPPGELGDDIAEGDTEVIDDVLADLTGGAGGTAVPRPDHAFGATYEEAALLDSLPPVEPPPVEPCDDPSPFFQPTDPCSWPSLVED